MLNRACSRLVNWAKDLFFWHGYDGDNCSLVLKSPVSGPTGSELMEPCLGIKFRGCLLTYIKKHFRLPTVPSSSAQMFWLNSTFGCLASPRMLVNLIGNRCYYTARNMLRSLAFSIQRTIIVSPHHFHQTVPPKVLKMLKDLRRDTLPSICIWQDLKQGSKT